MEKNDKELNIELSLERLEIIVSKMESGEVSLEKSLVLFEGYEFDKGVPG